MIDIQSAIFYMRSGLKTILADRVMFVTDFFLGATMPLIVQVVIWMYLYSNSIDFLEGYSLYQTLFYYAFALVIARLNNGYDVIFKLSQDISEGSLEAYIIKPFHYSLQRLFVFLGEGLLYFIPLLFVLLSYQFFSSTYSLMDFLLGFVLIVTSQILCFGVALNFAVVSFWLVQSDVMLSATLVISTVFGGLLLPPSFWPESVQGLMSYNPFRYMIAGPSEFFVNPSINKFIEISFGAGLYAIFFCFLFVFLWRAGIKRYEGAGG